MNCQEPYRISQIDLNNIIYLKTKENQNKKVVYIKYQDKDKVKNLVFQTPTLININNIEVFDKYCELEIPLMGKNKEKVEKLINFFNNVDDKIMYDAKINSQWFHNFMDNIIRYQKIIRDSDLCSNGVIRIKIIKTPDFETLLQINNKLRISSENIPINHWVKMILEIYAIWINENGFGLFLRPIIISFKPLEKINYNYTFLQESDDDLDNVIESERITQPSIFIKAEDDIDNQNHSNTTTQLKLPIELSEDSDSINKLQINISSKFSSSTSSENTEKKLNDDISLSTSTN